MKLNNRKFDNWNEGLTIEDVIKIMNYTFPMLVIKVNGKVVKRKDCASFILNENDDLKIHHLISGG